MRCIICQKDTKPWCLIENKDFILNEDGQKLGDKFQACSYSCCRKLDKKIGTQWCHSIMNREDFCWLRPIVPRKKNFTHLTAIEVYELSDFFGSQSSGRDSGRIIQKFRKTQKTQTIQNTHKT